MAKAGHTLSDVSPTLALTVAQIELMQVNSDLQVIRSVVGDGKWNRHSVIVKKFCVSIVQVVVSFEQFQCRIGAEITNGEVVTGAKS